MKSKLACAFAVLAVSATSALAQELPLVGGPLIDAEALPVAVAIAGKTNIAQSTVNSGDVSVHGRVADTRLVIDSVARTGSLVTNSASVTISAIGAANSVSITNTTTSVRPASGR